MYRATHPPEESPIMRSILPVALRLAALSLAAGAVACGSTESSPAPNGTDTTGEVATTGDSGASGDAPAQADVPATKFVNQCTTPSACKDYQTCASQVCVLKPSTKAELTDPKNFDLPMAGTPLNLACVGQADDKPAGPDKVVLWGMVDRFGGGITTEDLMVEVFKLEDFQPEKCPYTDDLAATRTCLADLDKVLKGGKASLIGSTTSIDADPTNPNALKLNYTIEPGKICKLHRDCPLGYDCLKSKGNLDATTCLKLHGTYVIAGPNGEPIVPTNTPLIVRARHPDVASEEWHTGYQWGLYLYADNIDKDDDAERPAQLKGKPTYRTNASIVSKGQWQLVPNTLGVGDIVEGNAAVGGRIRDCRVTGAAARPGMPVHNASIGFADPGSALAFYNDDEDNTVPVASKQSTDTIGRYSAIDFAPGPNRVSATALVGGQVTELGAVDFYTVPDSLILVSFPGKQAYFKK